MNTFRTHTDRPSFTCPACDHLSHHPRDVVEGYCGSCHWWTGVPDLAWGRPDLFTAHGKTPPLEPFRPNLAGAGRGHSADVVILDETAGFDPGR
jgi:hypothetical protein